MSEMQFEERGKVNSTIDLDGFKENQRKAFLEVWEAIAAGEPEIGLHFHIRGGKTMLMRILAKQSIDYGKACVALIVNNRAELRKQCADPYAFRDDCSRVGLTVGRLCPSSNMVKVQGGREIHGDFPDNPWSNNEYILSVTVQTLASHRGKMETWIESVQAKHGLPVLVFIDEAQEVGTDADSAFDRVWEGIVNKLRSLGVILVSLSGFPHREDGKTIPGFKKKNSEADVFTRTVLGEKIEEIDDKSALYETHTKEFTVDCFDLEPIGGDRFEFPLQKGFASGALCDISEHHITRKVTIVEDGETVVDDKPISELSESDAKKYLRRYLFNENVIDDACKLVEKHLATKRKVDPSVKAMVFSCSDEPGRSGNDDHAKLIEKSFKSNTTLKARVITGNSFGDAGEAGIKRLLAFKDDDYDVVILKLMGRVGFDCPRAKVLCDLSDVRAHAKCVQTWLRVSTPYKEIAAVVIHPNDPTAAKHYWAAIGKNMEKLRYSKSNTINSGEVVVTKKDRDLIVGDLAKTTMTDSSMREATSEEVALLPALWERFKNLEFVYAGKTQQEAVVDILRPYLSGGGKLVVPAEGPASEKVMDPIEEIARINRDINCNDKDSKRYHNTLLRHLHGNNRRHVLENNGYNMNDWNKESKKQLKMSCRDVGLPYPNPTTDFDVEKHRAREAWYKRKIEEAKSNPCEAFKIWENSLTRASHK